MIGVAQARQLVAKRLASHLAAWAVVPPESPAASVPLKPPTERAALEDQGTAQAWAREWRDLALPAGAEVDWETRDWRRIGRQEVPVRLRLGSADVVAAFSGGAVARDWRTLSRRIAEARLSLGESAELDIALRRHGSTLTQWTADRFETALAVVGWLVENSASGMRPRQLPIRGVDTKWLAAHRTVVTDLHRAVSGRDLGLVDADRLVRVRALDPGLTAAVGGLVDVASPAEQVGALAWKPRVVLILENLESLLALPPLPGVVAVHGSGYAVDVVGRFPWLRSARVVYWGDLDSHGFAILHRLRTHLPEVVSILMDETTLLDHRDLWVPEPKPARGEFDTLAPGEAAALARVRDEGDVRLEQERVPWTVALDAVERAVRR